MATVRESVNGEPHEAKARVARNSRSTRWIGVTVVALASSWSVAARAEDGTARREPSAVGASPAPSTSPSELPPPDPPRPAPEPKVETESYALPLAVAYLLTPGVALMAGMALSDAEVDDGFVVLGAAALFAIPAGVHLYHERPEQAGISFATTVGFTMGGVLAGGIAGYVVGNSRCDHHDCFKGLDYLPVGALIGGTVGYVSHAIWDVAAHSDAPKEPEAITHGAPVLWFYPSVSRSEQNGESDTQLDGFQVGLTLSM